MAELDNLLGSRISLITQQDIRYEGVLFSINQNEASIVLRDVRYFGTEDRVVEKKIAGNDAVLAFVSFPGNEIKDLYVHEGEEAAPTETPTESTDHALPTPPPVQNDPPAVSQAKSPARKQQQSQSQPSQQQQQQQQQQPRRTNNRNAKGAGAVGTGAHLLHLRERNLNGGSSLEKVEGEFDLIGSLTSFNKDEVLAEVASEQSSGGESCYKKDNFFDMLSSSADNQNGGGRSGRMSAGEERSLNQDTFGAIALQQSNRNRYGYGGRGRGGGRGGGRRTGTGGGGGGKNRNGSWHGGRGGGGGKGGGTRNNSRPQSNPIPAK